MTDSFNNEIGDRGASNKLPPIDFGSQLLRGGPSISEKYRNHSLDSKPGLHAEPGPAPSIQPRSNYDKFPDTLGTKPWWPTDTSIPTGPNWPFTREDVPLGFGVHWAVTPPVVLPPRSPDLPPQYPPGPTGPVPDGPVFKPDTIQPLRLGDDDARKSVHINADARSIYLTAGLAGAGASTGTHLADVYTGAIAPEERTGLAAIWRNNFSPAQAEVPGRAAVLQGVESQLPVVRTLANAAERTFDRQVRFRTQLVNNLTGQIPSTPLPAAEADWYNARVALVRDNAQFQADKIFASAGTQAEVDLRQKLFTHEEATQMASQASDYWKDYSINSQAHDVLAETEASRNQAAQLLTQAERGSITTGSGAFLKGLGQGLVVATAAVAADNILDRTLGNSPELSNQAHWGVQGIGVPLLLLSNVTPTTKVLGSVAMVGISHTLDQYFGPPTGVFSPFARPSLPEVGLATLGALAPVQDIRVRAGLAATGWLAGKAWNYLDDRYELTGKTEPRLRNEASAAADMDLKAPSIERFDFAVNSMQKFSDKNDAASSVLIRDWQSSTDAKTSIEKERGSAALMLGFGQSMLERGTRVDQNKWDENGNRILAGLNYDLGGQATTYLRAASGNLQAALQLAKDNKGGMLGSGTINDAYISQLNYEKSHADMTLEKVYGKHDISAVYSAVKAQVADHEIDMQTFGENLAQYAKTISDDEPRFKAKIARDLALIHVAFGENDSTAGGKTEHFGKAMGYVQQAFRLDPNAADQNAVLALLNTKR